MLTRFVVFLAFIVIMAIIAAVVGDKTGVQMRGRFWACILHRIIVLITGAGILYLLFYWGMG